MYYFEWDENKNTSNKSKHGVDFNDALGVFFDVHRLTNVDDRRDYGEVRYQTIGVTKERLLFVVYTERVGNTVRLISARSASQKERVAYDKGNSRRSK